MMRKSSCAAPPCLLRLTACRTVATRRGDGPAGAGVGSGPVAPPQPAGRSSAHGATSVSPQLPAFPPVGSLGTAGVGPASASSTSSSTSGGAGGQNSSNRAGSSGGQTAGAAAQTVTHVIVGIDPDTYGAVAVLTWRGSLSDLTGQESGHAALKDAGRGTLASASGAALPATAPAAVVDSASDASDEEDESGAASSYDRALAAAASRAAAAAAAAAAATSAIASTPSGAAAPGTELATSAASWAANHGVTVQVYDMPMAVIQLKGKTKNKKPVLRRRVDVVGISQLVAAVKAASGMAEASSSSHIKLQVREIARLVVLDAQGVRGGATQPPALHLLRQPQIHRCASSSLETITDSRMRSSCV